MLKQIVLSLFIFSVFFGCADKQQPIMKAEVPAEVTESTSEYDNVPFITSDHQLEPGLYRMVVKGVATDDYKISGVSSRDLMWTEESDKAPVKVFIELTRQPWYQTEDGKEVLEIDSSNLKYLPRGKTEGHIIFPTVVVKITELVNFFDDDKSYGYKGELIANITYPDRLFEYE